MDGMWGLKRFGCFVWCNGDVACGFHMARRLFLGCSSSRSKEGGPMSLRRTVLRYWKTLDDMQEELLTGKGFLTLPALVLRKIFGPGLLILSHV